MCISVCVSEYCLTMYLNEFNLRLQGETKLICNMLTEVKAFLQKLILFESQLMRSYFTHSPCCEKLKQEAASPFSVRFAQDILSEVKLQFNECFSNLDANATEVRIFQNPFDCVIDELPPEVQMEVIDLQSNDMLKDKYKEGKLIEFHKCLPSDQYIHLKNFARGFISVFDTTYFCEKIFL
ncbi:general transcription factor II-I repeat domain-containing protein 2B-like [Tachypleus tridentatus]|uniref:general transcription factor II-I repeat domain-containing protein 2B-like n=1 Tax=Tachypleus tridentatus TaxID=6853 RepID=UPI003FD31D70